MSLVQIKTKGKLNQFVQNCDTLETSVGKDSAYKYMVQIVLEKTTNTLTKQNKIIIYVIAIIWIAWLYKPLNDKQNFNCKL